MLASHRPPRWRANQGRDVDRMKVVTEAQGSEVSALKQQVRELSEACKPFTQADSRRASIQLLTTSALFFPLLGVMFLLAPHVYAAVLVLALPAGALLTRFFALQHDCGHGSLFPDRRINEAVGRAISVLTLTPYDYWRRSHATHHAGSGNLERRGIGDLETLTVGEYRNLGLLGRLRYRLMRHPLVALVIGPPVYFLLLQRMMFNRKLGIWQSVKSIAAHDGALLLFYGVLFSMLGVSLVLSVVLPVVFVGAWIGGALFYVQHQFEDTLWQPADEWDVKLAALKGSSHLVLPRLLNWLTCDIGIHHVHHFASRIPNYRLRECLNALPSLQTIAPRLTLRDAAGTARLSLWDETERKLISFRQYRLRYC